MPQNEPKRTPQPGELWKDAQGQLFVLGASLFRCSEDTDDRLWAYPVPRMNEVIVEVKLTAKNWTCLCPLDAVPEMMEAACAIAHEFIGEMDAIGLAEQYTSTQIAALRRLQAVLAKARGETEVSDDKPE